MPKKFNCRTDCELQSVAVPAQSRNTKIWFNFTDPIETCVNPRVDSYVGTTQDTNMKLDLAVERRVKNDDLLNCQDALCVNRGVVTFNASAVDKLVPPTTTTTTTSTTTSTTTTTTTTEAPMLKAVANDVVYNGAVYPIMALTPDYALGGVFTANAHFPQGTFRVVMRFSNSRTTPMVNYDQYEVVIESDGLGEQDLVSAVFSEIPADMGGTGWDKTAKQSFYHIMVLNETEDAEIETPVSLGNFQVFDSMAEFEKNNVGWITCADTFEFNPTIDATDPDCVEQTLDPDTLDAGTTITAKKWSANFLDASPLAQRDDSETEAGTIATACGIVEDNLLLLPNFTDLECGFIGAQAEACNADEGYLKYSTLHSDALPVGDTFRIVQDEDGLYYAQFPKEYNGSNVTVIYPVLASVETYKIVVDGRTIRPVRIKVPYRMNGSHDWEVELHGFFNNIPLGLSMTETSSAEFTFTPTVKNGSIGKIRKITDARVTSNSIL